MSSSRDDRPYFFLSYARTSRRDPLDREDLDRWVYKLYKDLSAAILQMTEVPPEGAGFMDRENLAGAEWPDELTHALATCKVLVPLYSRRYFESGNCRKEWFAFARREFNQRARGRQAASAIVPALWAKLDSDRIPKVARSLQYSHDELGQRYCAEGFYGTIKLHNYYTAYHRAVHRLAERIIAIGDDPPGWPGDGQIVSAEPWVTVLLPWNSHDLELRTAEHDLREKLRRQLGRKLDSVPRRCRIAASGIPTLQDFGQILPEVTMIMLKRFRKEAPAHPPVGPVITRPRLRAADTESSGDSQ